jgi:hypothetical protein
MFGSFVLVIMAQRFNAGVQSEEKTSPIGDERDAKSNWLDSFVPARDSIYYDGDEPSVETLGYCHQRFDGRRSAVSLPKIQHDIHGAMIARLR